MKKICLLIAYDGTNYSGWQKQLNARTIQGDIEEKLIRLTQTEVALHGAGRTDAGVHADGMTAHFETKSRLSCNDFKRALNAMLSGAIRILDVYENNNDAFHSRFSTKGKEYHYTLYTAEVMPPEKRLYMLHQDKELHFAEMNECLKALIGTHDFSSFENSGSRDKSYTFGKGAVRTITTTKLEKLDDNTYRFIFIGDGFLKNMVRNMVGSILEVGRGYKTPEWFTEALNAKNREAAGPTAPPHGLKLYRVFY